MTNRMSGTNGPTWTMQDAAEYQLEYEEQDRKCKVESALRAAIDKRWRDIGVPVEEIKLSIRLRRRGAAKAEAFIANFARASAANGLVQGPQLNVFNATEEFPESIRQMGRVAKANDEGYLAGRGGLGRDANRYQDGSEESQGWIKWWQIGLRAQEHITGARGTVAQANKAQPKARGRPPKTVKALAAPEENVVPLKRPRGRPRKQPQTAA